MLSITIQENMMQTHPFQLGLLCALSIGLGVSLTSQPAIGYPVGAVSVGSNPIVNVGGNRGSSGWFAVMEAPAEHDLIVTDVFYTTEHSGAGTCQLRLSSGADVSSAHIWGGSYPGESMVHLDMNTGIRVPAGQSLELNTNTGYQVGYTFSGYLAQP